MAYKKSKPHKIPEYIMGHLLILTTNTKIMYFIVSNHEIIRGYVLILY
jgi:hypothetical protein